MRYAWIGVSTRTLTASLAGEAGTAVERGAAIECVVPGSPAESAGLRAGDREITVDGLTFLAGGDVVVAIDGDAVATSEDLGRIVATGLRPGQTASFTVVRDGEQVAIPVQLGERPARPAGAAEGAARDGAPERWAPTATELSWAADASAHQRRSQEAC